MTLQEPVWLTIPKVTLVGDNATVLYVIPVPGLKTGPFAAGSALPLSYQRREPGGSGTGSASVPSLTCLSPVLHGAFLNPKRPCICYIQLNDAQRW